MNVLRQPTIDKVELFAYEVPMRAPHPVVDGNELAHRTGFLLRCESGSRYAFGEAAPLPGFSRESAALVRSRADSVVRSLVGVSLSSERGVVRAPPAADELIGEMPSLRFAVEWALTRLAAEVARVPLLEWLQLTDAHDVSVNALIDAKTIGGAVEEARTAIKEGYGVIKFKVARQSIDADIRLLRTLQQLVVAGVRFRFDANRCWTFDEAIQFLEAIIDLELEHAVDYVEEPVSNARQLEQLAAMGVPLALDESLSSMTPGQLRAFRFVAAVVLKPTILGGMVACCEWANAAESFGARSVVSGAYETGVGTSALVALAAMLGAHPAGLDTYRRLATDLLQPPLEVESRVHVRSAFVEPQVVDLQCLTPVASCGQ